MANQIIEVPDIAVVKTISGAKQLLSLRDQKIMKEKALVDIGAGSGIKYEGDLYVLKSEKIVPEGEVIVTMTTTDVNSSFDPTKKSDITVDWGDGVVEKNVFSHTYTDGVQSHDIKFYGSTDALLILFCNRTQLISLNINNNTKLYALNCLQTQLTSLDISKATALKEIQCHYNQLTSLDVSKNIALTYLDCSNNQLTSLDVGNNNTALEEIFLEGNPLVYDQSALTAFANSLPDRTGETAGKLPIYDSASAAWIKDICDAKNWTIS